jgi:hypothetical protein
MQNDTGDSLDEEARNLIADTMDEQEDEEDEEGDDTSDVSCLPGIAFVFLVLMRSSTDTCACLIRTLFTRKKKGFSLTR